MTVDGFQSPGDYQLPATAPLYVDGMAIVDAIDQIKHLNTAPTQQVNPSNRFWSSPPRLPTDETVDGVVVELARKKQINYISLDLPYFPHQFMLRWWDDTASTWREFTTPGTPTSQHLTNVIRLFIEGAIPPIIGPAVAYQTDQNPSHYGAGHWQHYELDITPVTTSKIRLEGTRSLTNLSRPVPRTPTGQVAAYALGIRNLDFGWRVRTKEDVPYAGRDPDILTERESFTEVYDVLGSPVQLKMRENRATDLLRGSQWKSAPQPVSYAVVNFYVDARDELGNAQVIDRFGIKPLHGGANLNLYYSAQIPTGTTFEAADDPIVFPALNATGNTDPVVQSSGILFPDDIGYLDVSNQAIQWDPGQPWWMGVAFQPQFSSADTNRHVIVDTGPIELVYDGSKFVVNYNGGQIFQQRFAFDLNALLHCVVGYDGTHLSMWMPEGLGLPIFNVDLTGTVASSLRFGGDIGSASTPGISHGNYRLAAFVLKAEPLTFGIALDASLVIPGGAQAFVSDPETFLNKPQYAVDNDHSTDNALLRFAPSLCVAGQTSVNPYGFVGGPGDIYASIVWTPVMRDYKLRQGLLQFPPTEACFFKLEFSNLTPETYDSYQPITRKIKVYSSAATTPSSNPQLHSSDLNVAQSTGLKINASVAPSNVPFSDSTSLVQPTITNAPPDVLPTEALHTTDPGIQQKLDEMGSPYRFAAWAPSTPSPRYVQSGQHFYEEVEVSHANKLAYFVGLSGLEMYRVDYTASDDTEQYIEQFDDVDHIDPAYLTSTVILGTTNFVTNPSFENGITGHTLYTNGTQTGGTISILPDGIFRASSLRVAALVLGSTSSDRVGFQETFTAPDFTASVAYSIYARKVTGNATLRLQIEYYNSTPTLITTDTRTFTVDASTSEPRNLNPGFEVDASNWTPTGCTLVRTTSQSHQGVGAGLLTPDGVSPIVYASSELLPVRAGTSYRAQGWLRCSASRSVNLNVNWFSASQVYISTTSYSQAVTANTWTFLSSDTTPPAGAAYATIVPTMSGTPASSVTLLMDEIAFLEIFTYWQRYSAVLLPPAATASAKVYWWLENGGGGQVEYHFDGYQVENLRVSDYTDGSIAGSAWNGGADASTSTRTAVDIEPWTWDGDKLVTSGSLHHPVQTQSKTFPSQRRLRGIQFATQQTGSIQLLPDPDFIDPTLADWIPVGDVVDMELSDDYNTTLGSALKIGRSSGLSVWGTIRTVYQTWAALDTGDITYSLLGGDQDAVGYGGVQLRNAVQVSEAGRIYAAARVYTTKTLQGPLKLQILGYNGDLLAEADQDVQSGRIVEWYVGYTIGETGTTPNTWASIMQRSPAPTYGSLGVSTGSGTSGTWSALTASAITQSNQVKVQVVQTGPGQDTWYVDSIAVYEDPILWEFSNDAGASWWPALDIRNKPSGVLIFPNSLAPSITDPTGLRWRVTGYRPNLSVSALEIRPWYAETNFGIPQREPGVSGGPNIQPTDHYPAIADDAMFKQWSLPIPQDWFFDWRRILALQNPTVPTTPVSLPTVFANRYALYVPTVIIPVPPAQVDTYADHYGDPYGTNNPALGIYNDAYDAGNTY